MKEHTTGLTLTFTGGKMVPINIKKTRRGKYQVEKTRLLVDLIEERLHMKEPHPLAGDIVVCRGPQKTYEGGHLNIDNPEYYAAICVRPYIPFVYANDGVTFLTSGGYWFSAPKKEMLSYVGTKEKRFQAWGYDGPCTNGAFAFTAKVNVWDISLDSIY